MRKGREGLCGVVREVLERSPHDLDFQTLLRNAKERNNPFFDHLFTAKV